MKLRRAITFSESDLSVKADLVSPPWQPWLKRALQTRGCSMSKKCLVSPFYLSLFRPADLNLPLISIACQSSSLLFFHFVCLFVLMGVSNVCILVSCVVVSFVSHLSLT